MKTTTALLAFATLVISAPAFSADITNVHEGNIIAVQLRDLRPTQSSVGFDEIYYKLERFSRDRKKMFNAFCELNGQARVQEFSYASDLHDPKSFACQDPVGSHGEDMDTVVIAPNDQLYLTNGHHKGQEFWHVAGGGPDLSLHVVVARDYRTAHSMDDFWKQMQADRNVWLFDAAEHPISVDNLPSSLGLDHFKDDPYRSLMYFTDHIAWEKPERVINPATGKFYPSVPFVEFYWAREVRKVVDLSKYDLKTADGYLAAMQAVSAAILNLHSQDVGGSGKTIEQMGQRSVKHRKADRAIQSWKENLISMVEYKSTFI